MAAVVESLEREMQLLCVTGVEDRLQADVRPTLEMLRNAGIKVLRGRGPAGGARRRHRPAAHGPAMGRWATWGRATAEPGDAHSCCPGAGPAASGEGREGFAAAASPASCPRVPAEAAWATARPAPSTSAHICPGLHGHQPGFLRLPPAPPCSVPPSRTCAPAASACPQPCTVRGDFLTGCREQGDPGPCGHRADPLVSLPTATQSFLLGGTRCPEGCSQPALLARFVGRALPRDHWLRARSPLGVCPAPSSLTCPHQRKGNRHFLVDVSASRTPLSHLFRQFRDKMGEKCISVPPKAWGFLV